jgi:hypothetical protein
MAADDEPKLLTPPGTRDLHTPPSTTDLSHRASRPHDNTDGQRKGSLLDQRDDRSATELPEFPAHVHDWYEGRNNADEQERNEDGGGTADGSAEAGQHSLRSEGYSEATTADDSARGYNRYRLVRQTPNWYDGVLRWWRREISVKVEAEKRRDHLGMT